MLLWDVFIDASDECSGHNVMYLVGSLKMNTTLEYSTRVVQKGDRRCKKSTLNDLAYLTPLRIPLMNPVIVFITATMEEGTLKTPIPKCRLYWSVLSGEVEQLCRF